MNGPRILASRPVRFALLATIVSGAAFGGSVIWDPLESEFRARRWQPTLAPSHRRDLLALESQFRITLWHLAVPAGGMCAVLLLGLQYMRTTRASAHALRRAYADLEQRASERTLELLRTADGLKEEIAARERADASLQYLAGRLLRLQDEERRRIARELHDSTGGLLAGLSFDLEMMQRRADHTDDADLAALARDSSELVGRVTAEIRTLSHLLYPPLLDELGLEHVLPWYVAGFAKRSAIRVKCGLEPNLSIPEEVGLALFRIVQEALTNIHRHSQSTDAEVAVWRDTATVSVRIEDHGHGMPTEVLQQVVELTPELGVGIAGMRERVRQLGGKFQMTSSPAGTIVCAAIPVPVLHAGAAEPALPSDTKPVGRSAA